MEKFSQEGESLAAVILHHHSKDNLKLFYRIIFCLHIYQTRIQGVPVAFRLFMGLVELTLQIFRLLSHHHCHHKEDCALPRLKPQSFLKMSSHLNHSNNSLIIKLLTKLKDNSSFMYSIFLYFLIAIARQPFNILKGDPPMELILIKKSLNKDQEISLIPKKDNNPNFTVIQNLIKIHNNNKCSNSRSRCSRR